MRLTTDALIIRENNNIGESDRFVTALTRDLGVIRASARGARQLKNRSGAATKLLTYSRLTLFRGRDKYIIDEAEPLQLFFELHSDIERLALAQYFCELAGVLAPREEAAEPCLRLLLNALHYLCTGGRDSRLIKAVVELKLLAFAGYMPNLTACASCGAADAAGFWLLPPGPGFCSAQPAAGMLLMGRCRSASRCLPRCGISCMARLRNVIPSRCLRTA